jgi:hypothetical protein
VEFDRQPLDQVVDLSARDSLGERLEDRIGGPPRTLAIEAPVLADALQQGVAVDDLHEASTGQ